MEETNGEDKQNQSQPESSQISVPVELNLVAWAYTHSHSRIQLKRILFPRKCVCILACSWNTMGLWHSFLSNFRHFESLLLHEPFLPQNCRTGPLKLAAAKCTNPQQSPLRDCYDFWGGPGYQRQKLAGKAYIKGSLFVVGEWRSKNTWWFQFSSFYIYRISKSIHIYV